MSKVILKNQVEYNSLIVAIFTFHYSLVIPLTKIMSAGILVAAVGILLMLSLMIYSRKIVVNINALLIVAAVASVMMAKHFLDGTSLALVLRFLLIALPPIVIYSYKIDYTLFLDKCMLLSKINFLMIFWVPFSGSYEYMRFGYGMLLTTIFSVFYFLKVGSKPHSKKITNFIILCVSLVEMFLYGARGALLCFAMFVIIYVCFILRSSVKSILIAIASLLIVFNFETILLIFQKITSAFGMGSYVLRKMRMMLRRGFAASMSGRDKLYSNAIEQIQKNPIFGTTMNTSNEGEFVHNLFLQVGVDLGVLAIAILMIYLIYVMVVMAKKSLNADARIIIAVIFCVSVGRLLVSSTLWERPEFWALLCLICKRQTYIHDKYMSDSKIEGFT